MEWFYGLLETVKNLETVRKVAGPVYRFYKKVSAERKVFILFALTILFAAGGVGKTQAWLTSPATEIPYFPDFPLNRLGLVALLAYLISVVLSWRLSVVFGSFIDARAAVLFDRRQEASDGLTSDERDRIRLAVANYSGIVHVWIGKQGKAASEQDYAEAIRAEIGKSGALRLLTIVGHEYLGKRNSPLIYGSLEQLDAVDVELVVVDQRGAPEVIGRRLEELKKRADAALGSKALNDQYEDTKAALRSLKDRRPADRNSGRVCLRLTKDYPPFRLLILDHCLFMSAYSKGVHGHESVMYRIDKLDGHPDARESLYDSFVRLYENTRSHSEEVDINA